MIGKGVIDHDVIISSRLSLARNLANYPFVCTCSVDQLDEIDSVIRKGLGDSFNFVGHGFEERPGVNLQEQLLAELAAVSQCDAVEQYSVSPEFDAVEGVVNRSIPVIAINDENHFRISVTRCDGDLMAAWQTASELDDQIEERFPIAFSQKWGYLTTSPADLGTAMRVSMTVFLPGLAATQQTEKLFRSLQQKNLIARSALSVGNGVGVSLETTEAVVEQPADLFQISNLSTLGVTEVGLIQQIETALPPIINLEREARAIVLSQPQSIIELQIKDALQQLCQLVSEGSENQPKINQLLSRVRYGVSAGLAASEDVSRVLKSFSLARKRSRLVFAVKNEEYAVAAAIRDHIRLLEEELSQWDSEEYEE